MLSIRFGGLKQHWNPAIKALQLGILDPLKVSRYDLDLDSPGGGDGSFGLAEFYALCWNSPE